VTTINFIERRSIMSLEKSLIEKSLPILDKELEKEYFETVSVLKEMITMDEENKDFFESPSNYLKKKGLLTLDSIDLPNGEKIDFYDDEEIRNIIKLSREKYFNNGEIAIPEALVYKENILIERRYLVYADWKVILVTDFLVSPGEIDRLDFGPLMSPIYRAKLKEFLKNKIQ
jgi:hypothetical protein